MNRVRTTLAATLIALCAVPVGTAQADSTLYVGSAADGCPNAQFTDLTTAVRYAQSHDIIRICPGTYYVGPAAGSTPTATTQGLVITKALTIIGAGASKVTIEPSADLVSAASTTDNPRDVYGNVITAQAPPLGPTDTSDWDISVSISGVTVSNGGHLVDAGVEYYDATGAITASAITPYTGTPAAPANDPNVGWGVVMSNGYAVTPQAAFARDLTVSGDAISNYGGGGVLIDGSEASKPIYFRSGVASTASITNNAITGGGSSALIQQYGIQVNAGARAAISGNVITGNLGATAATATNPGSGVGILLTDADLSSAPAGSSTPYMSVSGNDLTGNGYGLFNGTADFPAGAASDANSAYPIDVNGTGTTPSNLPMSLTNTAQSTATIPVTVSYQVPGVALASPSKANYYGPHKGVVGGPSTATDDGVSESSTGGTDSVKTGTIPTSAYAAPTAPALIVDAPPSVSWGTPDSTDATTLTGGKSTELLALASDDFGVTSVDISAGGSDLGVQTLPPYEVSWTPPASLIGQTIPVTATATDSSGQVTTTTINVTIVAPPAISWYSPSVAISPAHVLSLTPSFSGDITAVSYSLDNTVICQSTVSPFTCTYKLTAAEIGVHTVTITASSAEGDSTTVSENLTVARFAPAGLRLSAKRTATQTTLTGSLVLPAGVSATEGYSGLITVHYGKRTVTAKLSADGHFTIRIHGRLAKSTQLRVTFAGNKYLSSLSKNLKLK